MVDECHSDVDKLENKSSNSSIVTPGPSSEKGERGPIYRSKSDGSPTSNSPDYYDALNDFFAVFDTEKAKPQYIYGLLSKYITREERLFEKLFEDYKVPQRLRSSFLQVDIKPVGTPIDHASLSESVAGVHFGFGTEVMNVDTPYRPILRKASSVPTSNQKKSKFSENSKNSVFSAAAYVSDSNGQSHSDMEGSVQSHTYTDAAAMETEKVVITVRNVKVCVFNDGLWDKRGVGTLQVLRNSETERYRTVSWDVKTNQVTLNASLPPVLALKKSLGRDSQTSNSITISMMDCADATPQVRSFLLMFHDESSCNLFEKAVFTSSMGHPGAPMPIRGYHVTPHMQKRGAASVVQRWYRVFYKRRTHPRNLALVRISKWFRHINDMFKLRCCRSAVLIQRWARYRAFRLNLNALKIQKLSQGFRKRQILRLDCLDSSNIVRLCDTARYQLTKLALNSLNIEYHATDNNKGIASGEEVPSDSVLKEEAPSSKVSEAIAKENSPSFTFKPPGSFQFQESSFKKSPDSVDFSLGGGASASSQSSHYIQGFSFGVSFERAPSTGPVSLFGDKPVVAPSSTALGFGQSPKGFPQESVKPVLVGSAKIAKPSSCMTVKYRVRASSEMDGISGVNVRKGVGIESEIVKTLSPGEIVECRPGTQIAPCGRVVVTLLDGTYTTLRTSENEQLFDVIRSAHVKQDSQSSPVKPSAKTNETKDSQPLPVPKPSKDNATSVEEKRLQDTVGFSDKVIDSVKPVAEDSVQTVKPVAEDSELAAKEVPSIMSVIGPMSRVKDVPVTLDVYLATKVICMEVIKAVKGLNRVVSDKERAGFDDLLETLFTNCLAVAQAGKLATLLLCRGGFVKPVVFSSLEGYQVNQFNYMVPFVCSALGTLRAKGDADATSTSSEMLQFLIEAVYESACVTIQGSLFNNAKLDVTTTKRCLNEPSSQESCLLDGIRNRDDCLIRHGIDCEGAKNDSVYGVRYSQLYYCGRKLDQCQCGKCDGRCGPDNGCPCEACLDYFLVEDSSRVNGDGVPISRGSGASRCKALDKVNCSQVYYCGRKFDPKVKCPCGSCDEQCGPNNGCPCKSCLAYYNENVTNKTNRNGVKMIKGKGTSKCETGYFQGIESRMLYYCGKEMKQCTCGNCGTNCGPSGCPCEACGEYYLKENELIEKAIVDNGFGATFKENPLSPEATVKTPANVTISGASDDLINGSYLKYDKKTR